MAAREDDSTGATEVGAPEITAAIIDAGVDALSRLDLEFDQPFMIVREVFQAMMEALHVRPSAAALDRQSERQSQQWWT